MARVMSRGARCVLWGVTAFIATAAAVGVSGQAVAAAPGGEIRYAGSARAVAGKYIVVLKDGSTSTAGLASSLTSRHGGSVRMVYGKALRGFELSATEKAARALAADPAVAYVEQDQVVSITATQTNPPSWGLDRIDQRNRPLNQSYTYPNTASNVTAYIIDTGIRTSHSTFGGRASVGFDSFGGNGQDCHGHGTHVAGTVGGSQYGVAKGVRLVAVRVLNCSGSGTTSGVIAGVNFVTNNHASGAPAVANMSLGGGASTSLDNAVRNSIADGVTYAIAAGNSNANACNASPARVSQAITVGSTTSSDARSSFSNFGTCVDIFAPGSGITSAWSTSNTATNTISGTSMATPHVAGAAALVLGANGGLSPQAVRDQLVNVATTNVISNVGSGSPNRLLFVSQ